jgi:sugar lactone lactonase YvrE
LDQVRDLGATSSGPTAVVAGPPGIAYVLTSSPAAVVLVDLGTGEVRPYSTIPNVAPCVPVVRPTDCDASPIDRPPMPWALAFDTQGNGFVADAGQGAIWRIPRGGGAPTEWLVDTTFARTDRPSGPTGLAFDGAGNLVMAVPATLTDDAGVIYVQSRTADGSAGARRTLATMKAGEHPASIAISQPGHLYVALPDSSTVVVLDSDGTELRRIAIDAAYNAGTITGVAFQATSLLVAGRASTPEGQTGIVSLQVGEPGGELSTP